MNVWENALDPELVKNVISKAQKSPMHWEKTVGLIPKEFVHEINNDFSVVSYYMRGVWAVVNPSSFCYRDYLLLGNLINMLIQDEKTVRLCSLPEDVLRLITEMEDNEQKVRAAAAYLVVKFLNHGKEKRNG